MEFKIGDIVKVVKSTSLTLDWMYNGQMGVIVDVKKRKKFPYYVRFIDEHIYSFNFSELELA